MCMLCGGVYRFGMELDGRVFQAGVEVVLLGRYWVGFFVIMEMFGLHIEISFTLWYIWVSV